MGTIITPDGYPYPDGADPISNGDNQMGALAAALAGRTIGAYGKVSLAGTANSVRSVGVTFPAGRFNVALPLMMCFERSAVSAPQAANFWAFASAGGQSGVVAMSWASASACEVIWMAFNAQTPA